MAVPFGRWVWCACEEHARGGATARGPKIAGWCPHPTGGASHPRDFSPARIAPAAIRTDRGTCFSWSGTDPDAQHTALHVRHRPVPVSRPARLAADIERVSGPVASFARSPEREPPASGATMAFASFLASPHVTANSERPSSRLVENVREPSGGGSRRSMARAQKVGMKWRIFFWRHVGCEQSRSDKPPSICRQPSGTWESG